MFAPTRFLVTAALSLPLMLAAAKQPAPAGERLKVAGAFAMKVAKQEAVPVVDQPGHLLMLAESQGLNQSTGRDVYMDGAEVWSAEIGDLTLGNGSNSGHLVLIFRGDTVHTCWFGRVRTVPTADGQAVTDVEGKWAVTGAAGSYRNASGDGTYRGRFTGPGEYMVDWQGEIVVPEHHASR